MKLLFITPPMGNWAPWGDRHLAVNSLHAQVAAFIREKKAAEVSVLDCRALGLDDDQMIDEVKRQRPDAVFFGAMIAAAGGAATLNRFHAAMQKIKDSRSANGHHRRRFDVHRRAAEDHDRKSPTRLRDCRRVCRQ